MKQTTLMFAVAMAFILLPITAHAMGKAQESQPAQEAMENLKPYPEKIEGFERYVIYLAPQEDESLFQIELFAGKTMEVDCNKHGLIGSFTAEDVEGWGYTYYRFTTEGRVVSTLMSCPDPKIEKFVYSDGQLVRYNSRLPLVVYVQKGYELKYKVWTAGEEQIAQKQ